MVADVPVIILLEKLQKLQNAEERVRPPELRAEVVTAVDKLRRIFSFLANPNRRNITENLKGLLDSIYSADNTTESVLTTVQGRRKGVTETRLLQEFRSSFDKVSDEFEKIDHQNLPIENVDPITDVSEREGFEYDQELYVLTGREEEEKELVQRLIKDDEKCLRAIPLVSEELLGKTALARTVYNKLVIRQHFHCRAWVRIPKDLKRKELLIIILRTIPDCVLKGIELLDEYELIGKLVTSLMEHRFLIVLDNVFELDIWHMLARSFADARNGSRVILTTRLSDVARDADPWSSPMKLEPLTRDKSWKLFLKKTGGVHDPDLDDKILGVCEGFPAAILLLGGLLSTIELSEWKEVLNHVAGEGQSSPSNIVNWSYHKLPGVLKPCFLYLATFPKAYEIPIRRLLHLWLAEGFVLISSKASDVNVAKKYFDELVRRNMIEIQRRKPDGTPKTCLMPCCLYDEFLPKAEDTGFFAHQFGNDSSSESRIEHLRSYVSFNDQKVSRSSREIATSPITLVAETGSSPLMVLDLEGVYKPMAPNKLRGLQNLRYISFRWTCLDSCPECIGSLPCLEILDLKYTNITTLPSSIWKAKNLRHLYMNEASIRKPPKAPSTILQSVTGLLIDSKDPEKYGLNKFTGLRKLGLTCRSKSSVEKIARCISQLDNLQTLKLRSRDQLGQPLELSWSHLGDHSSLLNLYLFGAIPIVKGKEDRLAADLPRNLKMLTLSMSGLEVDPMPVLAQLRVLNVLRLFAHSFLGSKMTCSTDKPFAELRVLKLWNIEQLKVLEVGERSMPKLQELELRGCEVLTELKKLEHLTALKELSLTNMPKDFVADVKKIEELKDILITIERKSSTLECKSSPRPSFSFHQTYVLFIFGFCHYNLNILQIPSGL